MDEREEVFRDFLITLLDRHLVEERKKPGKYAELVVRQEEESERASQILQRMSSEDREVIEAYIDSIFATHAEAFLGIYCRGGKDVIEGLKKLTILK